MKEKIRNTWGSFTKKQKIWICIWTFLNLLLFFLYVGPAGAGIFQSLVFFLILEFILIGYYTRLLAWLISPVVFVILYALNFFKKPKKEMTMEWSNSIMFAVIVATFIKSFFIEAYNIPTPSMEKSMLVGDFLFVSRLDVGQRLPMTPISFPFVHNQLPWIGGKSYTDALTFPYYRLPGVSTIKNGDIIVFNWPADPTDHPVDKRENYIKRCVGIPGDSISLRQGEIFVNGKSFMKPDKMQYTHRIEFQDPAFYFSKKQLKDLGINVTQPIVEIIGYDPIDPNFINSENRFVWLFLTDEKAAEIRKMRGIASVTKIIYPEKWQYHPAFGNDTTYNRWWNVDNYGPLWIPKKGATIRLSPENYDLYSTCIKKYENNPTLKRTGDKIYLEGKVITEYTFKMDYYFMIGDNRHNSLDSRFWGFVPEDHIVGRAMFVWLSMDYNESNILKKIRWSRFLKKAHSN